MLGKSLMDQIGSQPRKRAASPVAPTGPTPEQMARAGDEHAHQAALMLWANQTSIADRGVGNYPGLEWFSAVPNGGDRDKITAGQMLAEGVKAGVYDTHLPVARGGFFGLMIEMKKPGREADQNGGLSAKQVMYRDHLERHGYAHAVAYSWQQARDMVLAYYRMPPTPRTRASAP